MLFQFRQGFYYAYIFVTVIYIIALLNIPAEIRPFATVIVLFTDTTVLGFFFIGAIVLLEKSQNIHESIFVTPLRLYEYFISKIVSLTIISFASSILIVVLTNNNLKNIFVFSTGVVLVSSFFTLFGFIFASGAKNVNDYFARALGIGLIICLPITGFLQVFDTPVYYLFPTKAAIIVIDCLFNKYTSAEIIYSFCSLSLWIVIAYHFAIKTFTKNIILKAG